MIKIMIIWFLIIIKLNFVVYAKDVATINFIKSFIQNERKPTTLIAVNLCWQKSKMLQLSKVLSNSNIRSSTHYKENNDYLQDNTLIFLVDFDCMQTEAVFNNSKHLRSPYRWLVLYDNRYQNQLRIQELLDLPLYVDSDFILAERNEDNFALTELHKPSTKSPSPTYSNPRGYYNGHDSKLIDTRPHRELFKRRNDVMGHPLTMSNVIQDSNSSQYHLPREDRLELQYDTIAKISWMHVHVAFQMLNATPRYVFSHRFGYLRDGQWSGMINDLETGRAELGTNCVATPERLSVAIFTDSIAQFKVKFIFRQPPLSYMSNIFTLPFSISVWKATICSIIISSVTICISTKWDTFRLGTNQPQLDGSFGEAMLFTMSALSQQGYSKEPKKLPGRIILVVVFFALMSLYVAYSANIVVLLQAPSKAIKTLEQLANSKMTIAAVDVDYNHFILKAGKDPVRQAIHRRVEPAKGKPHYYNLDEGVELVRQGLFAFHAILPPVYLRIENTFLETEKCDLMEVDFLNAPDPFAPIYKHTPYLELLKVAFKRIRETGVQNAQQKRIHIAKPRCADTVSVFSSVGLVNLRPVLLLMIYGIGMSVIILLAEILVHRINVRCPVRNCKT